MTPWTLLLGCAGAAEPVITQIEPGLDLIEVVGSPAATVGDSKITILRADPARFEVVVLFAGDQPWHTAKDWALSHDLVATTNPGMFEPSGATTFLGRTSTHVSHEALSGKAGSMIVAEPVGDQPARVVDMRCDDWTAIGPLYRTQVQSYRVLDCDGAPAWQPSTRRWSHALVGQDDAGRILFVHSRSAWSTREFAEVLEALPLGIVRLHYGEGGPEATLYVHAGAVDREWIGSYETGFHEADDNARAWDLPNIVGLRRK